MFSIFRTIERVISAVREEHTRSGSSAETVSSTGAPQQVPPPVVDADFVDYAAESNSSSEAELERWERKFWEVFAVVEQIEKERNEWTELYRKQAREHLAAQTMLEGKLISHRQMLSRAVAMLNDMRKEKGLELVRSPDDLLPYDGEPVGTAAGYAARMKALHASMPEPIDGKRERQRIAEEVAH